MLLPFEQKASSRFCIFMTKNYSSKNQTLIKNIISPLLFFSFILLLTACSNPTISTKDFSGSSVDTAKQREAVDIAINSKGLAIPSKQKKALSTFSNKIDFLQPPRKGRLEDLVILEKQNQPKKIHFYPIKSFEFSWENPAKKINPTTHHTPIKTTIKPKKTSLKNHFQIPCGQFQMKENAEMNIQHFGIFEGLKSPFVNALLKDSKSNFWIGSHNSGIARYNGKSLLHFDKESGLSDNQIECMIEDRLGNLWIGTTNGGVTKYDGNAFYHYTQEQGLPSNNIHCILEDAAGNIWMGTGGGGVCCINQQDLYCFSEEHGLTSNHIRCLTEDNSNKIWIGTEGGGICCLDYKQSKITQPDIGVEKERVLSIHIDQQQRIWIGTEESGVMVIVDGTLFQPQLQLFPSFQCVWSILSTANSVWLGTETGLVEFQFNEKENPLTASAIRFSEEDGLSHRVIKCITTDGEGGVWCGTDGGGINKINAQSFYHLTEKSGLSSSIVRTIFEDTKNRIWIGTDDKGVNVLENNKIIQIQEKNGLSSNIIWSICEDDKQQIWIGSYSNGITILRGNQTQYIATEQGLSSNIISTILRDKKNRMWIGTYGGGINIIENDQIIYLNEDNGLNHNVIRSLLQDQKGNFWIGTAGGGICHIVGDTARYITTQEGLSSNDIFSLFEDRKGNIWIGTNKGGINVIQSDQSILKINQGCGLSNNDIRSISQDNENQIWATTENGINIIHFDPSKDLISQKDIQISTFQSKQDGLKYVNFYRNSCCIDRQNCGWWGSGQSLIFAQASTFLQKKQKPQLMMTQIEVNQKPIDFYNHIRKINKDFIPFENFPRSLQSIHSLNHLTFHFISPHWSSPHQTEYRYKIEEIEEEWSQWSKDNFADYRNISIGKYTLSIQSRFNTGEESEILQYHFNILPPWWKTNYAYTIYCLILIGIYFVTIRWNSARLVKKARALQQQVDVATEEILQEKIEVEKQRDLVKTKNYEILSSIEYARRIQLAIMPDESMVRQLLGDAFVFYLPKDIVAGDFFWVEEMDEKIFFGVCDCTGHGVPGAMVSVLCHNALSRSVLEFQERIPGKLLEKTREILIDSFSKSQENVQDGMDASVGYIDRTNNILLWSGANLPIWIIRKNNLIEYLPNKQAIGIESKEKPFITHEIPLEKGDVIYAFTDGYADQFGGELGKKLTRSKFKQLLVSIHSLPIAEQKIQLSQFYYRYKKEEEQVDDICILGIKY